MRSPHFFVKIKYEDYIPKGKHLKFERDVEYEEYLRNKDFEKDAPF